MYSVIRFLSRIKYIINIYNFPFQECCYYGNQKKSKAITLYNFCHKSRAIFIHLRCWTTSRSKYFKEIELGLPSLRSFTANTSLLLWGNRRQIGRCFSSLTIWFQKWWILQIDLFIYYYTNEIDSEQYQVADTLELSKLPIISKLY